MIEKIIYADITNICIHTIKLANRKYLKIIAIKTIFTETFSEDSGCCPSYVQTKNLWKRKYFTEKSWFF